MSIPFSRSMRSLNADSFRPSLVGLSLAIILLAAWLAWFFLAQIALYEISQIVWVNEEGIIVADFPLEAQGLIWPGQPALFHPNGTIEGQASTIPAVVIDVVNQVQEERVRVELLSLADPTSPIFLQSDLTGQLEIEIERVSPAILVMQATGQLLDAPQISVSPQNKRGLKQN